jgi:hypothetical protein
MVDFTKFELEHPIEIPDRQLFTLPLAQREAPYPGIATSGNGIMFTIRGWFEVLLTVHWDTSNTTGHRFAHTAIPDDHPLHSEAIDAAVLSQLSEGKQLLRGNTLFEPGRVDAISLSVWHDSGEDLTVHHASIGIRALA